MGKKYVMKADAAGNINRLKGSNVGGPGSVPASVVKSFTLTVTAGSNGQVHFNQGGQGFNPFEIIGFLETMKTNVVNGIK